MIIFRTKMDSFNGKVGVWLKPLGLLLFGSIPKSVVFAGKIIYEWRI